VVVLAIVDLPFLVMPPWSPVASTLDRPEGYCQLRERDVTNHAFVHGFCAGLFCTSCVR